MRVRWGVGIGGISWLLVGCASWLAPVRLEAAKDPYADAPPYLRPLSARTSVKPLLTVGHLLPLAGGEAGQTYRFVGRPGGLGIYPLFDDDSATESERKPKKGETRFVLLINHELQWNEGGSVGPLPGGARVSEVVLDWRRARYLPRFLALPRLVAASGRCAIEQVSVGEVPQRVDPVTRGFSKLCSGFLADARVGFDQPIFLIAEDESSPRTFDPRGGQAWAVVDRCAYALPHLGRAEWEGLVVAPFTGTRTVVFGLEGAAGDEMDSQLYMYVGEKQPEADDVLVRNGLRGGQLFVVCADDSARGSDAGLQTPGDSISVHWVPLDWGLADTEFDAAARAAGGFRFAGIEDGALDPRESGILYFVTTGHDGTPNAHGRLYRLQFDPDSLLDGSSLKMLLDGSEGIVHPDNLDVNRKGQIAIQEDPGEVLRDLGLQRDSSIWIYDTRNGDLDRIATMDRSAARRHAQSADAANAVDGDRDLPGSWKSSGIVDASELLGRGTWVCTVQAPSLRIAPADETVEGGQVLLLKYR